jgi:cbb3-type cytochrome c oxidase subunit III
MSASAAGTVLDGVYTAAQAARGQTAYAANCASCHRADLTGFSGPPLKGGLFMDRWREFKLSVLYDLIKTTMPMDNPHGLASEAYLDILAFMLRTNEIPAGSKELTEPVVAATLLVGKNGPQPLPGSTPVEIVGCFTLDQGNGWFLTHAAEPLRTLNQWEAAPEELKAAKDTPLGGQVFRLQNLTDLPGFKSDDVLGQKMDARGILVRQPGNERINVTFLKAVGAECEP